MRITGLEACEIAVPFRVPYRLSRTYGTLAEAHAVILRVHTDVGLVGLGEADPMNPFTEETPASVLALLRDVVGPRLVGQDPVDVARLDAALDGAVHGNPTARGAVSMALHDLVGQALAVPVHVLLGGRLHDTLPMLGAIGDGTPHEDAAAIEALAAEGYGTVMIKMGARPIPEEVRRMVAARERFGDRLRLIVDANQGWAAAEALAFVDGIRSHWPDLIEQPVPRWDLDGLRRVRERAACAVSADESLVTLQDAAALVRGQAVDVFSLKVSKNGGLTATRKLAQVAEAFGVRCLMNSMLEFGITQAASLHLGATLPNLAGLGHAYHSVLRMADDVTDFRRHVVPGLATVPREPGLGVRLDEARLAKYARSTVRVGRSG